MPAANSYTGRPLAALATVTASGVTIHVRDRNSTAAVADVRLSRAELREMLDRVDFLASLDDTIECAPVTAHARC